MVNFKLLARREAVPEGKERDKEAVVRAIIWAADTNAFDDPGEILPSGSGPANSLLVPGNTTLGFGWIWELPQTHFLKTKLASFSLRTRFSVIPLLFQWLSFSKRNSRRFAKYSRERAVWGAQVRKFLYPEWNSRARNLGGTFWNSQYLRLQVASVRLISWDEIPSTEMQVVACERNVG